MLQEEQPSSIKSSTGKSKQKGAKKPLASAKKVLSASPTTNDMLEQYSSRKYEERITSFYP